MGTARKYGCAVEVVEDSMSEDQAFELECSLIEEYGLDNLANMTTGGDGSSGVVSSRRKAVCCSNGMEFESLRHAMYWLRDNGYPKASVSTICLCCNGTKHSSCGLMWWYKGNPKRVEYIDPYVRKAMKTARQVVNNVGMEFVSAGYDRDWETYG